MPEKCEYCGMIEGHANKCFVDVLYSRFRAMEQIIERAKILVEAPTDHAKTVAEMKLKDALHHLEIVNRRESRMVGEPQP